VFASQLVAGLQRSAVRHMQLLPHGLDWYDRVAVEQRDSILKSFHEKAGRGQDILRFFLAVCLFPFS
jgi:hypothetical protein